MKLFGKLQEQATLLAEHKQEQATLHFEHQHEKGCLLTDFKLEAASKLIENKFVYAVLQQLSVTEAFTANKFEHRMAPTSVNCDEFVQAIIEASNTKPYNAIANQIGKLAQLIANACLADWSQMKLRPREVKQMGLASVKIMLPVAYNYLIDAEITSWIQTHAGTIVHLLNTREPITDLDLIKTTLGSCFPNNIDVSELNDTILALTQEVNKLQDPDWEHVRLYASGVDPIGFFSVKPEGVATATESKWSCTIS